MNVSLAGKVAVVCGSTQGIGLAAANELAAIGATCILLARNSERLADAVAQLPTPNGQQHGYEVADFSKPDEVTQAITAIVKKQPVHILINNSGGPAAGPIIEATPQHFLAGITQHLVNNQQLTQAVLPGMLAAQYGRIINIISTSVKLPLKNLGVSNTVRHAVAAWAKSLSNEIGSPYVTVNNVLPGFTDTARLQTLIKHNAAQQKKSEEDVAKAMRQEVPLGRFGLAEEIAAVVAFLATPAAAYVHGASIPVDGGRTGSI